MRSSPVASELEVLHAILAKHGAPDVIVANAGIGMDAPFIHTSDDLLKRVFDVNVFGVVRTIRPFVPAMIARGSGRILIVSSVVGKRGVPSYAAYSASKFALHGLADGVHTVDERAASAALGFQRAQRRGILLVPRALDFEKAILSGFKKLVGVEARIHHSQRAIVGAIERQRFLHRRII